MDDEAAGRWASVLYGGWGEAALGAGCALLLMWAFGKFAHWWWILPLSVLLGVFMFDFILGLLEPTEPELEPEPPPRKRKSPPAKPRASRPRRKSKVVNLAAERARRAGVHHH